MDLYSISLSIDHDDVDDDLIHNKNQIFYFWVKKIGTLMYECITVYFYFGFFFVFVISSVTKKKQRFHMCQVLLRKMDIHAFLRDDSLFTFIFFSVFWNLMKNGKKFFVFICSKLFHILTIPYYEPMDEWSEGKKKKKKVSKISKKKISSFFPIPKFSCFLYANFSKALQNNNQIFFLC